MTGNPSARSVGTEAAGRSEPKPPTPMGGASVSDVLHTPVRIVALIANIAATVGWQAGEPGCDIAGGIVSWLAANPDQIERFMTEGGAMMVDGTIKAEQGLLTWRAVNGEMMNRDTFNIRVAARQPIPAKGGEA